ncbi:unnamed protein product [Ilex paraguariensis]|uniref:Transmembrane protein n=1 Tax=Ilex paraguariensis TaxID=185542 RepID=A0ABC8S929_9AQUA
MASRKSFSFSTGGSSKGLSSWLWMCIMFAMMVDMVLVGMAKTRGVSSIASRARATRKEKGKGKATASEQHLEVPLEFESRKRKKDSYEEVITRVPLPPPISQPTSSVSPASTAVPQPAFVTEP